MNSNLSWSSDVYVYVGVDVSVDGDDDDGDDDDYDDDDDDDDDLMLWWQGWLPWLGSRAHDYDNDMV